MRKLNKLLLLFFFLLLMGCSNTQTAINEPPSLFIVIDGVRHEPKLGSYCWSYDGSGVCADTAGPLELLEDETPIKVSANQSIKFEFDYEDPSSVSLNQVKHGNKQAAIDIVDGLMKAPQDAGIYYFAYSAYWTDEDTPNGDALYAFAIEVE